MGETGCELSEATAPVSAGRPGQGTAVRRSRDRAQGLGRCPLSRCLARGGAGPRRWNSVVPGGTLCAQQPARTGTPCAGCGAGGGGRAAHRAAHREGRAGVPAGEEAAA